MTKPEPEKKSRRPRTDSANAAIAKQFAPPPEQIERVAPGPVKLSDVNNELMSRAGMALKDVTAALNTLRRNMKATDSFAQIAAAKAILSLASAFPSKNTPVKVQTNVQVVMKDYARAKPVEVEAGVQEI